MSQSSSKNSFNISLKYSKNPTSNTTITITENSIDVELQDQKNMNEDILGEDLNLLMYSYCEEVENLIKKGDTILDAAYSNEKFKEIQKCLKQNVKELICIQKQIEAYSDSINAVKRELNAVKLYKSECKKELKLRKNKLEHPYQRKYHAESTNPQNTKQSSSFNLSGMREDNPKREEENKFSDKRNKVVRFLENSSDQQSTKTDITLDLTPIDEYVEEEYYNTSTSRSQSTILTDNLSILTNYSENNPLSDLYDYFDDMD